LVFIASMTRLQQLRAGLGRILTLVATILFATWGAVRTVLDAIARTTVALDYQEFLKRLPEWQAWLFSTPGWVPGAIAVALAILGLQGIEWVVLRGHSGGDACGYRFS
jgi:type III secretory pathway component EscT